MKDDLTSFCHLGVTFEQLSAWRDRLLDNQEAARIEQHLPSCRVCQHASAEMDHIAHRLRQQRELLPGMQVWNGVRRPQSAKESREPMLARRALGGIAAVATIVIIFLAFYTVHFHGGNSTTTAQETPLIPTLTAVPSTTPTTSTPTTFSFTSPDGIYSLQSDSGFIPLQLTDDNYPTATGFERSFSTYTKFFVLPATKEIAPTDYTSTFRVFLDDFSMNKIPADNQYNLQVGTITAGQNVSVGTNTWTITNAQIQDSGRGGGSPPISVTATLYATVHNGKSYFIVFMSEQKLYDSDYTAYYQQVLQTFTFLK